MQIWLKFDYLASWLSSFQLSLSNYLDLPAKLVRLSGNWQLLIV